MYETVLFDLSFSKGFLQSFTALRREFLFLENVQSILQKGKNMRDLMHYILKDIACDCSFPTCVLRAGSIILKRSCF